MSAQLFFDTIPKIPLISLSSLLNASLKRGPKPLGLTPPQTGLPKTLESGFIEIHMGHAPYRRIVFPKSLFSIWVNQRLPL
jgi:hypothetical protein